MTIGVLPWTTSLFAEYMTQPHGGHWAAVVYDGSFFLLTLVF